MRVKINIHPFAVPEYVVLETPPSTRQNGAQKAPQMTLGELDDETIAGLCGDFKASVLARAWAQRGK